MYDVTELRTSPRRGRTRVAGAAREELRQRRLASEQEADEIEALLTARKIYTGHEVHRGVRNGVPHFVAYARTDDAHPWIVIKPSLKELLLAMEES